MDIVVTEGPAVQGVYQQVIRDYPSLIGASVAVWESKRRCARVSGGRQTCQGAGMPLWPNFLLCTIKLFFFQVNGTEK